MDQLFEVTKEENGHITKSEPERSEVGERSNQGPVGLDCGGLGEKAGNDGGAPKHFCHAVFQPTEEGGGAPTPPQS